MKPNDRCAVIGFSSSSVVRQSLTSDKNSIVSAIDKLRASGGTSIYKGIDSALEMFSSMSGNDRQKYIILLSDGEDGSKTQSINSAKRAGENNIRIFAMMIGTGTLQIFYCC